MSRLGSALSFAAYLTLVGVSSQVLAQASRPTDAAATASPPGYDQAIDRALKEFEAGNFVAARDSFQQAHKIFPNARTLRALGKTEYELKNLPAAVKYLERALQTTARPLTAPQRAEAEQLLDSARSQIARYVFVPSPPDARLMLDGVPASLDEQNAIFLLAGDHFLEAHANGYHSQARRIHVVGKVDGTIAIELKPMVAAVAEDPTAATASTEPAPPPPISHDDEETPLRRKWWLWTGLAGVVIAGAAVGVVLAWKDPKREEASGGSTDIVIRIPPAD